MVTCSLVVGLSLDEEDVVVLEPLDEGVTVGLDADLVYGPLSLPQVVKPGPTSEGGLTFFIIPDWRSYFTFSTERKSEVVSLGLKRTWIEQGIFITHSPLSDLRQTETVKG